MRRLLVVLSAVTLVLGCLAPKTSGTVVEEGRLHIEDPSFAMNLILVQDSMTRTPEGFLHAQVTLKNANHRDYRCQYRFEWKNKFGMVQKHNPSPWRPLVLHGRETVELDGVSLLQGTVDFRLAIRPYDM